MGCAIVHDAVDADMLHETISFSYCGTPTSNEWNDQLTTASKSVGFSHQMFPQI